MNLYKKCTAKPYFFLVFDTTLASNNPLRFSKNLFADEGLNKAGDLAKNVQDSDFIKMEKVGGELKKLPKDKLRKM